MPVSRRRFFQLPLIAERLSEIVISFGEIRPQFDSPSVRSNRLVQFSLGNEGKAEIAMSFGQIRHDLKSLPECIGGGIGLTQPLQRNAKIVMGQKRARF